MEVIFLVIMVVSTIPWQGGGGFEWVLAKVLKEKCAM